MTQSDSLSRATAPEERLRASSSRASWKRRIRSSGEGCHFSGSGPRQCSEIRSKGSWRRWRNHHLSELADPPVPAGRGFACSTWLSAATTDAAGLARRGSGVVASLQTNTWSAAVMRPICTDRTEGWATVEWSPMDTPIAQGQTGRERSSTASRVPNFNIAHPEPTSSSSESKCRTWPTTKRPIYAKHA